MTRSSSDTANTRWRTAHRRSSIRGRDAVRRTSIVAVVVVVASIGAAEAVEAMATAIIMVVAAEVEEEEEEEAVAIGVAAAVDDTAAMVAVIATTTESVRTTTDTSQMVRMWDPNRVYACKSCDPRESVVQTMNEDVGVHVIRQIQSIYTINLYSYLNAARVHACDPSISTI